MRLVLIAFLSCVLLTNVSDPVEAQAPASGLPTVTIALKNTDEFQSDLKHVMELDQVKGAKQWPKIRDILPAFLDGVDGTKPVRFDVLFSDPRDFRVCAPIAPGAEKAFQNNVEGFAGKKGLLKGPKLWQVVGPALTCWLRIVPGGYGVVAGNQQNVPSGFLPLADLQPLLQHGFDIAVGMNNTAETAEQRRQAMVKVRADLTEAANKLPEESPEEMETRRVGLVHQLDELERIFVDSQNITMGWTTDVAQNEGRLELLLTALPETSLEASIKELAAKPSLFSGVVRSEDSILFGRANHALDEMRRKNIGELLTLWEKQLVARIGRQESWDEARRTAFSSAAQKFFAMLSAGNQMGVIDGFVEVTQAAEGKTLTGAIRTADGTAAVGILQALKDGQWNVELDTAVEGDVHFHKVAIPEVGNGEFAMLFGQGTSILVATTPQAVYYAAGAKAEESLKKALAGTGEDESKNDGTFLEIWAKTGPWVNFLDQRKKVVEANLDLTKLTPEEKKARDESEERRKTAIAAFEQGKDTIHMQLMRKDAQVIGITRFAEGILRFAGMTISSVAAKRL